MTEQAIAQYITLRNVAGTTRYFFQNFWINEDAPLGLETNQGTTQYGFMPFAFSGTTVTKSGDNQPATLAFPNNSLSRSWAETVIKEQYLVHVRTVLADPTDKITATLLARYVAQIVSGSWNETSLELQMASVLDAVGSDIPRKKLTKQLVGNIPVTSRVRIQ